MKDFNLYVSSIFMFISVDTQCNETPSEWNINKTSKNFKVQNKRKMRAKYMD